MIAIILYVCYFWFSINAVGSIIHSPHLHSFPVFRTNKYHFIGIPSTDLLKHQYIQQLLKINENFIPKKITSPPSYPILNDTSKMQLVLPQASNNFYSRGKRQEVRRFPPYSTPYYFPHYPKAPVRSPHVYGEIGSAPYFYNMNPTVKENPILQKNNIGNQRPLLRITAQNNLKSSPIPMVANKFPLKSESNLKRHVNLSSSDTEYISPYLCRNNSSANFRSLENSLSFKPMGNLNPIETKNNFDNIIYENNHNGWMPKIQSYSTLYPILEYKSHIPEQKALILENKPILEYKVPIPKYSLSDPFNFTNQENKFVKGTNKSMNESFQIFETKGNKVNNLTEAYSQNIDLNNKHISTEFNTKSENFDQNEAIPKLNTKFENLERSEAESYKAIKNNENVYNKENKFVDSTEIIRSKQKFNVQNFEDKDTEKNDFFSSRNKSNHSQPFVPTISYFNDETEVKSLDKYNLRDEKRTQNSKFINENPKKENMSRKPKPVYESFFEDFFDYDTSFKPISTIAPTEPVFLPTVLPSFTYLPNNTSTKLLNSKLPETTEPSKHFETTTKEVEVKSLRFRPQKSKEFIFRSMNRSIESQSEKLKSKNIINKSNVSNAKREISTEKPCVRFDCNKNSTQIGKKYKRMHFKKFWKNNRNSSAAKNNDLNDLPTNSTNLTLKIDRKALKSQEKVGNEELLVSLKEETDPIITTTTIRPNSNSTIRPLGRHKIKLNIRNESNSTNSGSNTYRTRRVKDYSARGNISYQNKKSEQEPEKKRNETTDMKRSRKNQRRKMDTSTISSTLQNSNFTFIQNRQLNEDNIMPIESLFNFNINGSSTSTTTTTTTISPTTKRHIRYFESSTTESAIMKIAKDNSGVRRSNRRNRKYQKPVNIEDKSDSIEKIKESEVKHNVISWDSINYNKLTTNQPILPIEIYFKN